LDELLDMDFLEYY